MNALGGGGGGGDVHSALAACSQSQHELCC